METFCKSYVKICHWLSVSMYTYVTKTHFCINYTEIYDVVFTVYVWIHNEFDSFTVQNHSKANAML